MKTAYEYLKSKTLTPKKFKAGEATFTALEVLRYLQEYAEQAIDRCEELVPAKRTGDELEAVFLKVKLELK